MCWAHTALQSWQPAPAAQPPCPPFRADPTAEELLSEATGASTLGLTGFCSLGRGRASEGTGVIYLLFIVLVLFVCFALPHPQGLLEACANPTEVSFRLSRSGPLTFMGEGEMGEAGQSQDGWGQA